MKRISSNHHTLAEAVQKVFACHSVTRFSGSKNPAPCRFLNSSLRLPLWGFAQFTLIVAEGLAMNLFETVETVAMVLSVFGPTTEVVGYRCVPSPRLQSWVYQEIGLDQPLQRFRKGWADGSFSEISSPLIGVLNKLRMTCFFFLALTIVSSASSQSSSLINFQHLQHLTERIEFSRRLDSLSGDSVDIVHVYANYPNYHWVDAKESGPEGIACVDDAARAAVVYLRHYELTKNKQSLERAKALLKFVLKMQAPDGEFYNFIYADHSINKDGKTSFKSFGWWAARGVWCMALGERMFKSIDPTFAEQLHRGVERALPHIDGLLKNYGKEKIVNEYRIPQWLFYESGADATTELCLGLIEHYKSTRSPKVKSYIEKLSDGLMVMQDGDVSNYPFGLHRSWESMWHMWGNGQTQVLAAAGKLLKNKKMIQSAEREAKGFYSRLLIQGFMKEMDVAAPEKKMEYEQIAYGIRPIVVGLIRLYEATGKLEYLKMAGLAGSWFFGNNTLHQQMYDPTTGRCFDGLTDSTTVNKNSGAESTIEALHSMIELERFPVAMEYLNYRKVKSGETSDYLYGVFQNSQGDELTLVLDLKKSQVVVLEGDKSKKYGAVGKK